MSSTFRDMHAERDYLARVLFPNWESVAPVSSASHRHHLRWGVTEEEVERGKLLEIVLDEVKSSSWKLVETTHTIAASCHHLLIQ